MKLLVTGASGFVGREFCRAARTQGASVRECRRTPPIEPAVDYVLQDLLTTQDWSAALLGIDVVVHLAARVHQMQEAPGENDAAYQQLNVDASQRLIEQSALAGVRRFVFVSSIKVSGERSPGRPLTEEDPPVPQDAYARSKLEAEKLLRQLAEAHGMEWVVLRPSLVLGSEARGNVERLLNFVRIGLPLPGTRARRSYINVCNLADLILLCCHHPAAANQVFLAQDATWTTAELIRDISLAMNRPVRLLPVPLWLGGVLSMLPQVGPLFGRLCGELEVSSDKARRLLHWQAPAAPKEALQCTVVDYLKRQTVNE